MEDTYTNDHPGWDDDDDWYPFSGIPKNKCWGCGKSIDETMSIKAKDDFGKFHYLCDECVSTKVSWCKHCGSAFIDLYNCQDTCADCISKTWETEESSDAKL